MVIRTYSNDDELVSKRRDSIIRSAMTLFLKKGFTQTTTREIAKACGLSIGTLYNYIGSKEDILVLMSKDLVLFSNQYSSVVDENKGFSNATEKLYFFMRRYIEFVNENDDIMLFWYQEAKNLQGEARNLLFSSEKEIISIFEKVLAEGKENGEFHVDNTYLMANNIIVICDMWAFKRYLLRKRFTFDEYVKVQTQLILSQIKSAL